MGWTAGEGRLGVWASDARSHQARRRAFSLSQIPFPASTLFIADDTLEPHMKEIEEIDGALGDLESVVASLDEYSKRLGS